MRTRLRVLVAAAVVVAMPLVAVLPGQAANAQTSSESTAGKNCVSVLGKAPAGQESPELYRYCSAEPFDTKAHLLSAPAQSKLRSALMARGTAKAQAKLQAAHVLHIVRAWSAADYAGNYWDYYNENDSDGYCDTAGYLWRPDSYWSTHVSSLEHTYGTYCSVVTLYNRAGTASRSFNLDLHYVTADYNDNVGRMQIFSRGTP